MKYLNINLIIFLLVLGSCNKDSVHVVSTSGANDSSVINNTINKKYYFTYTLDGVKYSYGSNDSLISVFGLGLCASNKNALIYTGWHDAFYDKDFSNQIGYDSSKFKVGSYSMPNFITYFSISNGNTGNRYLWASDQYHYKLDMNVSRVDNFGGLIQASFNGEFTNVNDTTEKKLISGSFSVYVTD